MNRDPRTSRPFDEELERSGPVWNENQSSLSASPLSPSVLHHQQKARRGSQCSSEESRRSALSPSEAAVHSCPDLRHVRLSLTPPPPHLSPPSVGGLDCCSGGSSPCPMCWRSGMLCLQMEPRWSTTCVSPCSCTSEKSVSLSLSLSLWTVFITVLLVSYVNCSDRGRLRHMYAPPHALPHCVRSQLPHPEVPPPQKSSERRVHV